MREYELYRGYYCGICKTIGREFGQAMRFTLNYDSVFLAMITDGLTDIEPVARPERCAIHPIQKRLTLHGSRAVEYAADIHMILAYYKLKDDFDDDRSIKALLGMAVLHPAIKKMMKKHADTCIIILEKLKELSDIEKHRCASPDEASQPFALLMQAVFRPDMLAKDVADCLGELGYHLGKWIYFLDAYDDIEENRRNNSYNPFLAIDTGSRQIKGPDITERAEFLLMYHLGEMARIVKELPLKRNRQIVENILYLGMYKKTEEVLGIKGEDDATKPI